MLRTPILILLSCLLYSAVAAQSLESDCVNLNRQGEAALLRFKAKDARDKFMSATRIARELKNKYLIGVSLVGLGQGFWYESYYKEAADTTALGIQYLRTQENHGVFDLIDGLRIISNIYDEQGNYTKSFEASSESLALASKGSDAKTRILCLVQMGALYRRAGDYNTALEYFDKAFKYYPSLGRYEYRELYTQTGRLYADMHHFDSVMYYYKQAMIGHPYPRNVELRIGELYILENRYDSAYTHLKEVYRQLTTPKEADDVFPYQYQLPTMIALGKVYVHQHDFKNALAMGKEALEKATQKSLLAHKRDACLLLSSVYEGMRDSVKALQYYRQYIQLKDSLISDQFKAQLFAYKRKDDDAKHTVEMRALRNEKNMLATGILVICLLAIFVFFYVTLRHKNEKLYLKQRSSELEMLALRAQMNPHFIFNCLSAINHFILNNEADKASDYLTRFSRLIRLVLTNSGKTVITLEEELAMLKLYLDMEKLRFKDAFDYHIRYDAGIQPTIMLVPSLVLQPFCENAIWHGLLHNEGHGVLDIDFTMQANTLTCIITDNGIGRSKAAELKTKSADKQKSFGHKLTAERLALFNQGSGIHTSFVIEDVYDVHGSIAGTRVILKINNKQVDD